MSQKHEPDFDRGTVRYLASELEIPPRLAESGGAAAAAAMAELKKAHIAGSGMMRANHVAEAQKHIAAIDPQQHSELLQHLQAIVVTLGGKPEHTELVHATPGEIVIPADLRTPELMAALQAAAEAQGIDLSRFEVGNGRNSVNPRTGLVEFQDGENIEEIVVSTPPEQGLVQLPQNPADTGFYSYGAQEKQYGRAPLMGLIGAAAAQWQATGKPPIGIGEMSLSDGSAYYPHSKTGAHTTGLGVDIRPVRTDGQQVGANYKKPGYDQQATQQLVDTIRSTGGVSQILFNDPQIKGVKPFGGHDDHLHVVVDPNWKR